MSIFPLIVAYLQSFYQVSMVRGYTEEERFVMQLLTTEKYKGYKDLVLVSHSMGTIFLQNFLAKFNLKEIFNLNLKQIHFVAPTRDFGDFKIDSNWSGILNQSENIFIYSQFLLDLYKK